ncbi:hypothetical protein GOBAR_AA01675 [Gossypium barbadense]|uniref:Uncharacterized protein n=1 Tax=Gossypium barbadense TaxID=3634 RepID=A0A2P5YTH5_GOSBA|nr:hypothetical protein GOBAR_AA01675 [Gossypium barbadense]
MAVSIPFPKYLHKVTQDTNVVMASLGSVTLKTSTINPGKKRGHDFLILPCIPVPTGASRRPLRLPTSILAHRARPMLPHSVTSFAARPRRSRSASSPMGRSMLCSSFSSARALATVLPLPQHHSIPPPPHPISSSELSPPFY